MKKESFFAGDLVKITTVKEEFEGIVMPGSDNKKIVLKLGNGYNIGIDKKKIKKVLVKKKFVKGSKKKIKMVSNKKLKNITILHTGGTIASKIDYKTGAVSASFEPEDLIEMFPELGKIVNIDSRLVRNMWSDDLRFKHFSLLAKEIEKEVKKGKDGIIVGMGTDNLAVASAALAFILEDINIPVLFVGAQRSSDRGSSDAGMNIVCAAEFIRQSKFVGVGICMHDRTDDNHCAILNPCKTRKLHSSRRDAFKSVNDDVIARVNFNSRNVSYVGKFNGKDSKRKLKVKDKLEEKVGLLKIHVNMDAKQFELFKNYKGLVIEGTGLGHVPMDVIDDFTKDHAKIRKALVGLVKKGCVVVMCSNCIFGGVNMNVYSKGKDLQELGVLSGKDMLAETAFVKLSWLLANEKKDVVKLIGDNLRGEINTRVKIDQYLW
jgi:glutamyl-tRNA(Gln) amidotransferase subunit D